MNNMHAQQNRQFEAANSRYKNRGGPNILEKIERQQHMEREQQMFYDKSNRIDTYVGATEQ